MDNCSQYMSAHFVNQGNYWGIQPSFALVGCSKANGVAERFNRTLREQVTHSQIFQNVTELRKAICEFVDRYNAQWRLEKNGFLTPKEAREAYTLRNVA